MIDTARLLDAFAEDQYLVVQTGAKRTKKQDPREVKHLVRLRHADHAVALHGAVPEIVIVNAHDGSSSLRILSGLFRLICSNGLIVQSHTLADEVRIRHTPQALDIAVGAAKTVMAASIAAARQIQRWESIVLSESEQLQFAEQASALWHNGAIPADRLLGARRPENAGNDLWRTFNRVQENLTQGGLILRRGSGRMARTRGIRAVGSTVRVNSALWSLADRIAA